MNVPILWRFRLDLAPRAVITKAGEEHLYRYKDPKTGLVYVGKSRFDPFLRPSVINQIDGLTVQTEADES